MINIEFVNHCLLIVDTAQIQLDDRSRLSQHSSTCQSSSSITLNESKVTCKNTPSQISTGPFSNTIRRNRCVRK